MIIARSHLPFVKEVWYAAHMDKDVKFYRLLDQAKAEFCIGSLEEVKAKKAVMTTDFLLIELFQNKGARSPVKGIMAEAALRNKIQFDMKGDTEKICDHDTSLRYDFKAVVGDSEIRTIEVKTLGKKNKSVSIAFKDPRFKVLPSGRIWKTKARSRIETFDFLAVCLFNRTGSYNDFQYIHMSNWPSFKVRRQKGQEPFLPEDVEWIEKNFYAQSFSLGFPCKAPFTDNLEEMFR